MKATPGAAEADGHAEGHQQEEDGRVARIVDGCAKADDAGGAGDAKRARQRVADQHHRQRARHAEQHLRLLHGPAERRAPAGVTLHEGHEHADERRAHQAEALGDEAGAGTGVTAGHAKHVADGRQAP